MSVPIIENLGRSGAKRSKAKTTKSKRNSLIDISSSSLQISTRDQLEDFIDSYLLVSPSDSDSATISTTISTTLPIVDTNQKLSLTLKGQSFPRLAGRLHPRALAQRILQLYTVTPSEHERGDASSKGGGNTNFLSTPGHPIPWGEKLKLHNENESNLNPLQSTPNSNTRSYSKPTGHTINTHNPHNPHGLLLSKPAQFPQSEMGFSASPSVLSADLTTKLNFVKNRCELSDVLEIPVATMGEPSKQDQTR
jgi:hypothetical protein